MKRKSRISMRVYLDSNVFVFASTSEAAIGEKCAKILDWLAKGRKKAVTSSLTFDELFFKIKKLKGAAAAILFSENFLALPHLALANVDSALIGEALNIIKRHKLAPRDAIHAATARLHNSEVIVSDDKDFAKVKIPKWLSVDEFIKTVAENR